MFSSLTAKVSLPQPDHDPHESHSPLREPLVSRKIAATCFSNMPTYGLSEVCS